MNEKITSLMNYIEKSVTPYHAVAEVRESFINAGYKELRLEDTWGKLERGCGYFINVFGSACVAFYVGSELTASGRLKVVMAHTDSPGLKLKTSPKRGNADGTISINTEKIEPKVTPSNAVVQLLPLNTEKPTSPKDLNDSPIRLKEKSGAVQVNK